MMMTGMLGGQQLTVKPAQQQQYGLSCGVFLAQPECKHKPGVASPAL